MALPLLLMAGATAASSALQQTSAVKSALQASIEQNKGIVEQNLQGQVRAAYRVGLTRLGLAYQQRQLAQQSSTARELGLKAASEAEANAGATGAIGASAEAVTSDIEREVGDFLQSQETQREINNLNYNTQVEAIAQEAKARVINPTHLRVPSDWSILGRSLAQGAIQAGATYYTSKLSLGLGQPPKGSG